MARCRRLARNLQ